MKENEDSLQVVDNVFKSLRIFCYRYIFVDLIICVDLKIMILLKVRFDRRKESNFERVLRNP